MLGDNIRATMGRANFTLSKASDLMDFIRALLLDFQDGVSVTCRMQPGASKWLTTLLLAFGSFVVQLMRHKIKFLGGGESPTLDLSELEGQDVPFQVAVDPTFDILPPGKDVHFSGGPYDAKVYATLPEHARGKTLLTLEGGHVYQWDGHAFAYQAPIAI